MKEMLYTNHHQVEVLDYGTYKGLKYIILSNGYYPSAYVENVLGVGCLSDNRLPDSLSSFPHGGLSFCGSLDLDLNLDKSFNDFNTKWFGWDYNHIGDFDGSYCFSVRGLENYKKWKTNDIFQCVKKVIEKLNSMRILTPEVWKEQRYLIRMGIDERNIVYEATNESIKEMYFYGSKEEIKSFLENLNKQLQQIERKEEHKQNTSDSGYKPENLLEG